MISYFYAVNGCCLTDIYTKLYLEYYFRFLKKYTILDYYIIYIIWKLYIYFFRDNYSKPTCGKACFHFAYLWFNHLHFAHLRLVPLTFRNPPLRLQLEKHIFRQKQT